MIAAPINGENYYLKVGFDVVSFVTASMQAEGFLKDDGTPANPGKLARETLCLAAGEHHPDMDWAEFVESLPPSAWHEVWTAFDTIMDIIHEYFPDDGEDAQHTQPIDLASDSYIMSQGGHAA